LFESLVSLIREALNFFPRNEIDIFVPSAGVLGMPTQINPEDPSGLAEMKTPPPDMSSRIINTNLSGLFTGTMLVARYGMGLHKAGEGRPKPTKSIVLIASLAGYCGAEGSVEYTVAKFGVRGMLRGMRKLMAPLGVRLNAVAPFYVDTPMTVHATPVLQQLGIPLVTIDQVVEATARLATDENAWGE
jgi:5'-hydroxyaverantin dehydrogenase